MAISYCKSGRWLLLALLSSKWWPLYAEVPACNCLGHVWLSKNCISAGMKEHRPWTKKQQNLVPGTRRARYCPKLSSLLTWLLNLNRVGSFRHDPISE